MNRRPFGSCVKPSYAWNTYTFANYVSYISSYGDRGSNTTVPRIDPFLTWDASFLWRFPGSGIDIRLYALNLTGTLPPWANIEQSYEADHRLFQRGSGTAIGWAKFR